MPFITTEEVRAIRKALKRNLPEYKFSVRKNHHSTVDVAVLSGPVDFENKNCSINHYYLERDFQGKELAVVQRVKETILTTKPRHEEVYDGDYGSVPNFYISMSIGRFQKPYVKV